MSQVLRDAINIPMLHQDHAQLPGTDGFRDYFVDTRLFGFLDVERAVHDFNVNFEARRLLLEVRKSEAPESSMRED